MDGRQVLAAGLRQVALAASLAALAPGPLLEELADELGMLWPTRIQPALLRAQQYLPLWTDRCGVTLTTVCEIQLSDGMLATTVCASVDQQVLYQAFTRGKQLTRSRWHRIQPVLLRAQQYLLLWTDMCSVRLWPCVWFSSLTGCYLNTPCKL